MKPAFWQPGPGARGSAWQRLSDQLAHALNRPELTRPHALYAFSVQDPARFWTAWLHASGLPVEGSPVPAIAGQDIETARFFPHLKTSWPATLLRPLAPDDGDWPALCALDERGAQHRLTRGALRHQVSTLCAGLHHLGIRSGDRVAGLVRNRAETVVAALAVTSLGATWSSVAPDMGSGATLDRLQQLHPRWLIAHTTATAQGRDRSLVPHLQHICAALPALQALITLDSPPAPLQLPLPVHAHVDLQAAAQTPRQPTLLPFDHPLFVLFSSGTTGPPKCIVHGHGGTALEHQKELSLHTDLRVGDRLHFMTSTAWMMWNWLVSGLGCGAEIILYDGAPTWPQKDSLLQHLSAVDPTHFGTSPAYLRYLIKAGVTPPKLASLRAVLSTGSILYPDQFDDTQTLFGPVAVQSISGGTDIIGCFALGCPTAELQRGHSQILSLGYDVKTQRPGAPPTRPGTGELVCTAPFPSRPIGLLDDPSGQRFHAAYFEENPGLWTHGDFLELSADGTARILGRSDGVLNIRGIRIGPAELYRVLQALPEIADAMAIEQPWPRAIGGRRLVLLLVLTPGVALDRPLTLRVKKALRDGASRNHVPDLVVAVPALPQTHSGKGSERAVADLLAGRPVRNRAALRNPQSLDALTQLPSLWPAP